MVQLATLPGVDIVAAGTWDLSTGTATFTARDLADAVAAAQCPAVGSPLIKIGHTDDRFAGDGEPAAGKVTNLKLAASGAKITGDLAGMPGWLGDVAASAYPQRSIEGAWDYTCSIGHVHPFVISAVALLGVTRPGVGVLSSLDDVAALYDVAAAAGRGRTWRTATATPGGATALDRSQARRAITAAVQARKFSARRAETWARYLAEGGDAQVFATMAAVPSAVPAPTADQLAAVQDALNRHLPLLAGTAAAAGKLGDLDGGDTIYEDTFGRVPGAEVAHFEARRQSARESAAAQAASLTDDELYDQIFPPRERG